MIVSYMSFGRNDEVPERDGTGHCGGSCQVASGPGAGS